MVFNYALLVEAGGFEPPSEDLATFASTGVVAILKFRLIQRVATRS